MKTEHLGDVDELDDYPPRDYGPRLRSGTPRTCRKCHRAIDATSKRHVCASCTIRKSRGAETGERCEVCSHDDRRVLRLLRLASGQITACGNCAALAGRRALTLDELRGELHVVAA